MKYIYPAVFTRENDAFLVDFPDLPSCYTHGHTWEEAFEKAGDALSLMLYIMETQKETIPPPTDPCSIQPSKGKTIALIQADTLAVRKMNDTRAVRKNITLPAWMDTLAKEHNINFSQLLQTAICRECGIDA